MGRSYASFIILNRGAVLRIRVGMPSHSGCHQWLSAVTHTQLNILKPPKESKVQPMLHCLARRTRRWHWQRFFPRWYKTLICPQIQAPFNVKSINLQGQVILSIDRQQSRSWKKYRWETRICFLRENWCLPPIGVMLFCTESHVLVQQTGVNSESK